MMEFKDFDQALKRLEEIVAELEKGELALERALGLFEEGIGISRQCGEKLEEAEQKVEMLVKNSRGILKEEPFENGGGSTDGGQESGD